MEDNVKVKKYIDCIVPIHSCTLRCSYCYLPKQNENFSNELPKFSYPPEHIIRALSKKRLGGVCLINFCGRGETLLPPEMADIIKGLAKEGHYITIVTNGTVSKRFEQIIDMPRECCERVFFKFSYHYLELKRLNLLDTFFANIRMVKEAGCAITLEIGADDAYIPYLEEIKKVSVENTGALPHVVVLRDDSKAEIPILTKLEKEDYLKVWSQFDSRLFDFQTKIYNQKRREFCYGGLWSAVLELATGRLSQCYAGNFIQNIFEDINSKIKFSPIGAHCREPHCYNAHMFMIFGLIPELKTYTYTELRNRVCDDGSEWLSPAMKKVFSQKLCDNNRKYGWLEKKLFDVSPQKVLQNIFSVKNDGNHKVLRLVGVKLKFRKKEM